MDATAWDQRYASTDLVWSAGPNRFVEEVFGEFEPGRVVDLACGEGRNAIWLAGQGWTVTAIDFSHVAVDRGRELADSQGVEVRWRCADATSDPLEPEAYDAVLVCYLQLPTDELDAALANARTALAPDGRVVVIAHARDNLEHGVGGPQDPAVLPTPDQVVAALDGLEIERAGHVVRPVEVDGTEREAIDLLVVARRVGDTPVADSQGTTTPAAAPGVDR